MLHRATWGRVRGKRMEAGRVGKDCIISFTGRSGPGEASRLSRFRIS